MDQQSDHRDGKSSVELIENNEEKEMCPINLPIWHIVKRECSVRDCENNSSKFSMFAFPECTSNSGKSDQRTYLNRCKMWLQSCGNENLLELNLFDIHNHAFVCSSHFDADQYKDESRTDLVPTALPTLLLPLPMAAEKLEEYFVKFSEGNILGKENGNQHPTNGAHSEGSEVPLIKVEGPDVMEEEMEEELEDKTENQHPTNGANSEGFEMPYIKQEEDVMEGESVNEHLTNTAYLGEFGIPIIKQEDGSINLKQYRCSFCTKCFHDEDGLETHCKLMHCDEGPLKCTLCDRIFLRGCDFRRHNRIHTTKMRYVCVECERCFSNKVAFVKHVKASHIEGTPFYCAPCNRRFSCSATLKSHLRTHSGEKPFGCTLCDKRFFTNSSLKAHRLTHAAEGGQCQVCGGIYPDHEKLQKHFEEHEKETPFACHQCTRRFSEQKHLRIHLRTHSGTACYKCNDCNKRFSTESGLLLHVKTHLEDEPMICPLCNSKFTSYKRLINHCCRSPRYTSRYVCPVCSQQFSAQSVLDIHLPIHNTVKEPDKPYACSECYKRFRTKNRLDSHIRTQHNSEHGSGTSNTAPLEEEEDSKAALRRLLDKTKNRADEDDLPPAMDEDANTSSNWDSNHSFPEDMPVLERQDIVLDNGFCDEYGGA